MRFQAATVSPTGRAEIVTVAGEVDRASRPWLERVLRGRPRYREAAVIVDLTECGFMDASGVEVLERTHRRLDRSGGRLVVVTDNLNLLKLFRLTGLDRLLAIYPSRTAALTGDRDE